MVGYDSETLRHFAIFEKSFSKNSTCFMNVFEECEEVSIDSHSISAVQLKCLSESHHISTISSGKLYDPKSVTGFKLISVKSASTFPGFCNNHDNTLFKRIDTDQLIASKNNIALLLFRSFVQEAYKKMRGLALTESYQLIDHIAEQERKNTSSAFDLGSRDLLLQAYKTYNEVKYDKVSLKFISFEFQEIFPFCYLSPINFEIKPSFGDKDPLANVPYESCLIGLLPTTSGSKFMLGFPPSQGKYVSIFLRRLGKSRSGIPSKLLQLGLESSENLFFKPSWINSFSAEMRRFLLDIFTHDLSVTDVLRKDIIKLSAIQKPEYMPVKTNTNVGRFWSKN